MSLRYHYSILPNFLFLPLGIAMLVFGLDTLFFHKWILLKAAPPPIASGIAAFLGIMVTSGCLINILKGKDCVVEANSKGLTVHIKAIGANIPKMFVEWKNVLGVESRKVSSSFGKPGQKTTVLAVKVSSKSIKWPSALFSKNKISYRDHGEFGELTIDAWLNKRLSTVAAEINKFRKTS